MNNNGASLLEAGQHTAPQSQATQGFTPGLWPIISDDEYFSAPYIHHSGLEAFRKSPYLYWHQEIERDLVRESKAMAFGTAFEAHLFCLRPVVAAPDIDRRTKSGKAAYAEFIEENADSLIVDAAEMERIDTMVGELHANTFASAAVTYGTRQQAYRWTDEATDLPCMAKADLWCPRAGWMADLKTAADPTPDAWSAHAHRLGYHRQAAWYLDGAAAIGYCREDLETRPASLRFFHIVIGSQPPHECYCYEMDGEWLEMGRRQNRRLITELKACLETGDWRPAGYGEAQPVYAPRWAKYEELSDDG